MAESISRRDVLIGSAAAVVGLSAAKAGASTTTADGVGARKLKFGIIGAGGKGWSGMQAAAQFGDIVAICDIDAQNRSKAMLEHPKASTFDDYREMFEVMRGKMNAVVISTPDHHHAIASAIAMRQGCHCYTEKPLTRTIWETRRLVEIARETGVATQMGNHSTASTPMRKIAALIRKGTFGKVKEVHAWTDRPIWKQGMERPTPAVPPKYVDFRLWIGPRPDRPYGEGYHSFAWRGWWDFGTGALGDMACHIMNMPHMALDLVNPTAVQAETSGHNKESFPSWSIIHYEFPEWRGRPEFKLHWYDGGKRPDASLIPGAKIGGNGCIVVCENDTVYTLDESNTTFKLLSGKPLPEVVVDESPGHMAEFARAALGGPAPVSNFVTYAGPLAEAVLLGNLAVWANGPRLEWDSRRMQVKGTHEFDGLIRPTFRPGWSV